MPRITRKCATSITRIERIQMDRDEEQLVICEYDPTWPDQFVKLAARVTAILGALVSRIEHIGSTAVPGLAAKPIIDLDIVLGTLADLPEAIGRLSKIGYSHEGDLGITGREAFLWPPREARHHLYVLSSEAEELRRHVAFRDTLRADPVRSTLAGQRKLRPQCGSSPTTTHCRDEAFGISDPYNGRSLLMEGVCNAVLRLLRNERPGSCYSIL
jgi:GrpB-like predicted nucleotidyltransferase (UPF0157 family)